LFLATIFVKTNIKMISGPFYTYQYVSLATVIRFCYLSNYTGGRRMLVLWTILRRQIKSV